MPEELALAMLNALPLAVQVVMQIRATSAEHDQVKIDENLAAAVEALNAAVGADVATLTAAAQA